MAGSAFTAGLSVTATQPAMPEPVARRRVRSRAAWCPAAYRTATWWSLWLGYENRHRVAGQYLPEDRPQQPTDVAGSGVSADRPRQTRNREQAVGDAGVDGERRVRLGGRAIERASPMTREAGWGVGS